MDTSRGVMPTMTRGEKEGRRARPSGTPKCQGFDRPQWL